MLERTKAPEFRTIDKIDIVKATEKRLDNGVPVYSIDSGSQELAKIEFIFRAGMYYQDAPLIAASTNNMMENGTINYSADQISENLDFFGSYYETGIAQDNAGISLYTLNKHMKSCVPFVEDIIKHANFPEAEFRIYISNKKQKYLVNQKKVAVLARRKFAELIFGDNHPYGRDVKVEDFDRIKRNDLVSFFNQHYNSSNCAIVISGKLPADHIDTLNKHFGSINWGDQKEAKRDHIDFSTHPEKKHFIYKEDAIQSAIRVGRPMFTKGHPDYFKFQVLNTALGGYFGSRLMSNIREDKGYTYGIGSGLSPLIRGGSFFISTEVGADVTQKALDEIYFELRRLREEPIPASELELVKNYILGIFLRSVDGPFALADKFRGIWEFGLDYDYYDNYFDAVKSTTADELQLLANKYLKEEDLTELVVGKK